MTTYGYARVSTRDQDLGLQHDTLKAAGCTKIYAEKLSGARAENRPELGRLLKRLEPGDVVIVTRLDRLARSTRDLLNIVDQIGKSAAKFRSLGEAWCDTTNMYGELMMTIIGGIATFEHKLIISRTTEGRIRAKERGVHFGRKAKLNKVQLKMAAERYAQGQSMSEIAEFFETSKTTIFRALHGAP
jgi:DNA invertase Pin-like site-specific DNA recombinase